MAEARKLPIGRMGRTARRPFGGRSLHRGHRVDGVVFVDVGNVLVYDLPFQSVYSHLLAAALARRLSRPSITPLAIHRLISQEARQPTELHLTAPWRNSVAFAWHGVLKAWDALAIPVRDVARTLRTLAPHHLAILANQPREMIGTLHAHHLLGCFEAVFLDSAAGISKPDPEFFRMALARVGVAAEDATMIGDRLDNDIIPARSLGMSALWLCPPPDDRHLQVPIAPPAWTEACRAIALAELERQRRQPTRSKLSPTAVIPSLADAALHLEKPIP